MTDAGSIVVVVHLWYSTVIVMENDGGQYRDVRIRYQLNEWLAREDHLEKCAECEGVRSHYEAICPSIRSDRRWPRSLA
jgi:hypothetical protein